MGVHNMADELRRAFEPSAAGQVIKWDGSAFGAAAPASTELSDVASLATLTGTETLTNKTLASPVIVGGTSVHNARVRSTVAQVNAGATLVAAVTGYKIRLIDFTVIAVGGAVSGATGIYLKGTQSTSAVNLAAIAAAALTQSTAVKPNTANVTLIADGASFVACDAATAITIIKNGSDVATATHIDVILTYALEAA